MNEQTNNNQKLPQKGRTKSTNKIFKKKVTVAANSDGVMNIREQEKGN